jgi:type I restriction enzyme S subunit
VTGAWQLLGDAGRGWRWETRRAGDLVELTNGFPFDSEKFGPEGTLPLVRIRDLFLEEFTTFVDGPVPEHVVLRDGDIVIGMDGDFELTVWRRGPAALNQRMCLLRPRPGVDARFVAYAMPRHLSVINDLTYATTVKHLSSFDILAERILCPATYELQRAIADYLDAVTAQIDDAIGALLESLKLITEYRRSLITEVFREPDRTGRGSTMRALADALLGRQRSPEQAEGPHMVPYLRAANVKDGRLDLDDVMQMNFNPREQRTFALVPGDVLITEGAGSLAAVGANAIWNGEVSGVVCFQNTLIRLRPNGDTEPRFVAWWARYAFESGLLASVAGGANIYHLGVETVRTLGAWAPPLGVQRQVADRLDREMASLGQQGALRRRQIDLLLERRQALITAAVTGQLDIPGVAA